MSQERIWCSWITSQADGAEHAVTDEAHVAGMEAGLGWYEAACGEEFLAACMDVGPLRRCASCFALLRAHAQMRSAEERMSRPSWLSRLCHRKQPAGVGSDTTTSPDAPPSAGTHEPSAGAGCAPEDLTTTPESAPAGARHRRGRHTA